MAVAASLARAVLAGGQFAGRGMVDLVLPAHCPACDGITNQQDRLCAACFKRAGFITEPCCARCGIGFASSAFAGLSSSCPSCSDHPPDWRHARAAFTYDAFSRQLILPLKYADRTENARVLGHHMARAGRELLRGADLLVPVPLHRRRLFARRYNQAALLAAQLGRLSGLAVGVDALVRTRSTPTLVGQSAEERALAVAGAIAVRETRRGTIEGRSIVLVDDVLTTGATAGACARALLAGGAASVDVLAAARTVRDEA